MSLEKKFLLSIFLIFKNTKYTSRVLHKELSQVMGDTVPAIQFVLTKL